MAKFQNKDRAFRILRWLSFKHNTQNTLAFISSEQMETHITCLNIKKFLIKLIKLLTKTQFMLQIWQIHTILIMQNTKLNFKTAHT